MSKGTRFGYLYLYLQQQNIYVVCHGGRGLRGTCGHRSTDQTTHAQSDQDLHCPLTESLIL